MDSKEVYLMSKDKQGRTCLNLACFSGFFNIVEYLIKDLKLTFLLEIADDEGNAPLHLASMNGHLSVVSILLSFDINVQTKNNEGITALELSCRKGFFEISKLLINSYDTISTPVEKGAINPLHVAACEGAHEVVELLLMKGAQIDSLNEENENCLDIAIKNNQIEVIRVLLNNQKWKDLIQHEPKAKKSKKTFINFNLKRLLKKKDSKVIFFKFSLCSSQKF